MSVAVKTIPNSNVTIAIGSCSGSVTCQNLRKAVAPSIRAASSISAGIEEGPAREITVAKGRIPQGWMTMIEIFAGVACPSHCGGLRGGGPPGGTPGGAEIYARTAVTALWRGE